MIYLTEYHSAIGDITIASDGDAVVGLWFEKSRYFGSTLEEEAEYREVPVLVQCKAWLDIYFAGKNPGLLPPVRLKGTPFRMDVWQMLLAIPYGTTVTYGDIAREIAARYGLDKMSAQAVGGAVGHNPIGILVPCHRVVGSSGSLTGYAGGLHRKAALLRLEKSII